MEVKIKCKTINSGPIDRWRMGKIVFRKMVFRTGASVSQLLGTGYSAYRDGICMMWSSHKSCILTIVKTGIDPLLL